MTAFTDQFSPVKLPLLGLVRFPKIEIAPEDRTALGLTAKTDNKTVLRYLTWQGYQKLKAKGAFGDTPEAAVIDRLKTEFITFDATGIHDYLLFIWDINRWADQQGIVRGWGRGSAAGSLTNYCLGITRVNPLRHNLNFPRFVSEARLKPVIKDGVTYVDGKAAPDIDCDYQYGRREDVVKYIENKYVGHTCKISTRMELTGKTALKNALKLYADYADEDAQHVSDFIEARFGKVQSLSEAREQNDGIKKWLEADEANRDVYEVAVAIEGLAIGRGQHPSGVFIGYDPLDGTVPSELAKEKSGVAATVTSYDMETMAGLGLKADILAVRSLDLVDGAARLANVALEDISVDDPVIYEYLNKPETNWCGLFQIAEGTTKEAVAKVGPKDIDALSVCIAISRPGALAHMGQYVDYYRNGVLKPIYPAVDAALSTTGNVLVYQEQITRVCMEVFGMSGVEADTVRYNVGKKKKEEMAKSEQDLRDRGKARNVPANVVQYFWDVCNASADYLFCLSHAVSYVYLTAATVYLKAKYPLPFYLTLLRLAKEEPNPTEYMNSAISEMTRTGIRLLPPDIAKSEMDFTIEGDAIRFGLASIKGITDLTFSKLIHLKGKTFASKFDLFDAAKGASIPINMLTALIYSGCVSWPDTPRTQLGLEAQTYNLLTDGQKVKVKAYGKQHNTSDITSILRALPTTLTEKGKPLMAAGQIDRIRRDYGPYWIMYQANSKNETLSSYLFEHHYLGYGYTSTLHAIYSARVEGLITLDAVAKLGEKVAALPPLADGEKRPRQTPFKVVAFVDEVRSAVSKASGSVYVKLWLSDDTGNTMAMLFGGERIESCTGFNGRLPEEGDLVLVTGVLSKDGRLIFADSVIIQPNPVKLRKDKDD